MGGALTRDLNLRLLVLVFGPFLARPRLVKTGLAADIVSDRWDFTTETAETKSTAFGVVFRTFPT
jgi:hypothetical protein